MNALEITMTQGAWTCLAFSAIVLWMVMISVLLGINRYKDNKRSRKNEKEHAEFRKMMEGIQKTLKKIELGIQGNEADLKKTYTFVQTRIVPLMEKNTVVQELQKLLNVEKEKFASERRLTTELGLQLKKANEILSQREEEQRKKEKNRRELMRRERDRRTSKERNSKTPLE